MSWCVRIYIALEAYRILVVAIWEVTFQGGMRNVTNMHGEVLPI